MCVHDWNCGLFIPATVHTDTVFDVDRELTAIQSRNQFVDEHLERSVSSDKHSNNTASSDMTASISHTHSKAAFTPGNMLPACCPATCCMLPVSRQYIGNFVAGNMLLQAKCCRQQVTCWRQHVARQHWSLSQCNACCLYVVQRWTPYYYRANWPVKQHKPAVKSKAMVRCVFSEYSAKVSRKRRNTSSDSQWNKPINIFKSLKFLDLVEK